MRRISILLFLVFIITPVFADLPTKYEKYDVKVELNENGVVEQVVNLTFPEPVDKFNIYLLHKAKNLRVFVGEQKIDCKWSYKGEGTLISCKDFNSSNIHLSFDYYGLIVRNDICSYSDRYFITTPTDNFRLRVYLPKGYILSENSETKLAYYPATGIQKTDGKTIYIEWNMNPKLGEVYDISVYYEKALKENQLVIIILALIVLGGIFLLFIYLKRRPRILDVALTEDEKKVLKVVSEGGKVSQKKIVRETGFSKAHVSRIAKSLEARGLIERKRKGRSYEVALK